MKKIFQSMKEQRREVAADVFISGIYGIGIAFLVIMVGSFCFDLAKGVISQWF